MLDFKRERKREGGEKRKGGREKVREGERNKKKEGGGERKSG